MSILSFENISEETLYIALEIINSNPAYNILEYGKESKSLEELKNVFLNRENTSMFIKADDTYIGIMQYRMEDKLPWIILFMIHRDYQGFGFAREAYFAFQQDIANNISAAVRLSILKENRKGRKFWESIGFTIYDTVTQPNNKKRDFLQKDIK